MLPNIFILAGVLFIIFGVFVWIRLTTPQLHRIVKLYPRLLLIIILAGLAILGLGLWIKYAPRGNSLFQNENIDGMSTGNDSIEHRQNQEISTTGAYVSTNGNSYSCYIIVKEKTIFIYEDNNEYEIGGTEEFEAHLKDMDRRRTILLVDDYAASSTYHKTEELLDAYGMKYETESDE